MPSYDPNAGPEVSEGVPGKGSARTIILGSSFLGLVLAALALYLFIKSVESSRWDDLKRELDSMAETAKSIDPIRPVLRGTPLPGNAWTDYEAALGTPLSSTSIMSAMHFLEHQPTASREEVHSLVQRCSSRIEMFRRGVSRGACRIPRYWETGEGSRLVNNSFVHVLACHGRLLAESGQPMEGAEVLLDIAQFGSDWARNGDVSDSWTGAAIMGIGLREFKDLVSSGKFNKDEWQSLERQIQILDESFAGWVIVYRNDPLRWFSRMVPAEDLHSYFQKTFEVTNAKLDNQRFCFSDRLMIVDAFRSEMNSGRRLAEAFGSRWSDASRIQDQIYTERTTSGNPIIRNLYSILSVGESRPRDHIRECRAQLRLLWVAVHYRGTGEVLPLADPLGEVLHTRPSERGLMVWSVGPDGVDDGGEGDWKPGKGKDIVVEVEK
jgi:hypothetical protein